MPISNDWLATQELVTWFRSPATLLLQWDDPAGFVQEAEVHWDSAIVQLLLPWRAQAEADARKAVDAAWQVCVSSKGVVGPALKRLRKDPLSGPPARIKSTGEISLSEKAADRATRKAGRILQGNPFLAAIALDYHLAGSKSGKAWARFWSPPGRPRAPKDVRTASAVARMLEIVVGGLTETSHQPLPAPDVQRGLPQPVAHRTELLTLKEAVAELGSRADGRPVVSEVTLRRQFLAGKLGGGRATEGSNAKILISRAQLKRWRETTMTARRKVLSPKETSEVRRQASD